MQQALQRTAILFFAIGALPACAPRPAAPPSVHEIDPPAPAPGHEPNLALDWRGRPLLSWVEERPEGGHSLRFSALERGGTWSRPRTIASGSDWFVNWADFPSLASLPGAGLIAHWLVSSGPGTYDYDIRLSRSMDEGETWSAPAAPYAAGGGGEHGFVSMVPGEDGQVDVIWLDGRNLDGDSGATELRHARIGADGRAGPESVLDERVCDCCQTSAARTGQGVIVVYRDRGDGEVRDISAVRLVGDRWEPPRPLSRDGWEIHGCPVNGPAVDTEGEAVAVAWFTAAGDGAAVRLAFSGDGGASWGEPLRVDEGRPLGRVDVAMGPGGGAFVSWMENLVDDAEIRVRFVDAGGRLDPSVRIASSSGERDSGFPRLARAGRELIVVWTAAEDPPRVRAASVIF